MIRAVAESRAAFTFNEGRLGATGQQIEQGIYTGIERGAMFIPIVGPFVAAAAAVAQAFGIGGGCGASCTQATQVVNQIEPLMQANVSAAQQQATANGGCLFPAEVQVLTQNFQTLWQGVLNGCGALPAPGGTQCIADRKPGGKLDWTAYFLAPIQQIPVCPSAPAPASESTEAFPSTSSAPATSSAPTSSAYIAATTTTPATIAGIPAGYVYLGIGALALAYLVSK